MPKCPPLTPRVLSVLTCGLLTASCGDGLTGPPFAISLRGGEQYNAFVVRDLNQTEYRCGSADVEAVATGGRQGAFATWAGATLRVYGLESNRLLGTDQYSAEEIAEWMGGARIAAGERQGMYWYVWGTEPFRATVEYQYRTQDRGAAQSATFSFTCTSRPSTLTSTFLSFRSSPGDYIGQGQTQRYAAADGSWRVEARPSPSGFGVSEIRVFFDGGDWWWLDLAAPKGRELAPGTYTNATRWPFQAPTQPGLSFSGNGRGCNKLTGQFTIHELVLGPGNRVDRFHATFQQHCEGAPPALVGEVGLLANPWR